MIRPRPRADDPAGAAARERIRAWSRLALGERPDVAFTVSEIACGEQACGGVETIVLVMIAGRRTEAVKLPGRMLDVTWPAVLDVFARRPDLWD